MRAKFVKGITTGAMIGMAAGMMLMPQMDRRSKRRVKRSARMVKNTAGDMYDYMKNMMG